MEITPNIAVGRQVIESYGEGRFRVSGAVYEGSVLVFPERTLAWSVSAADDVTPDSLAPVRESDPRVEVLLLGCGAGAALIPAALCETLRADGVVIEAMATGAACRTYNVLVAEERRVAAALIAVD